MGPISFSSNEYMFTQKCTIPYISFNIRSKLHIAQTSKRTYFYFFLADTVAQIKKKSLDAWSIVSGGI